MRDTQRAAYEASKELERKLVPLVQRLLHKYPHGLTPDEIADKLHVSVLAIRPRITEMINAGVVRDTKYRRKNRSGKEAYVVALAEYVPDELVLDL